MNKKLFFIPLIASFALLSCNKEEVVSKVEEQNPIGFNVTTLTRGSVITTSDLTTFNVSAAKGSESYFLNVPFTKGTTYYTSSEKYFFPGDDSELAFYAWYPTTYVPTFTAGTDAVTATRTIIVPSTVSSQYDLITSYAAGKNSTNGTSGVALTFGHRFCEIEVKALNSNGYTMTVNGYKIVNAKSVGTLNYGTGAWSSLGTSASFETTLSSAVTLSSTAQSIGVDLMFLLPQELTAWDNSSDASNSNGGVYLAVNMTITAPAGASIFSGYACVPLSTTWTAGNHYVYTLDFSNGAGVYAPDYTTSTLRGKNILGSEIKFTETVTAWTDSAQSVTM